MNASSTAVEEFTGQIGFIVFFLISCLLVSMFFNEKVLYYYLLLVFAGEVVMNSTKVANLYRKVAA
jgi:uncharacterized membrane protein